MVHDQCWASYFVKVTSYIVKVTSYISRLTVVSRAVKKLQSTRPIKRRAATTVSYFTCRAGFAILVLDYATSLNRFVLRS